MKISDKAIQNLRKKLIEKYGSDFGLSDDDLQEIGNFLLTGLAESLKYKNMVK